MNRYRHLVCVGIIYNRKSGLRRALCDGTVDTLGLVLVNKHTLERSVIIKSVKELVQNGMLSPDERICIDGIHDLINSNKYGLVDIDMNVRRMTYTIVAIQKNLGTKPSEDFCPTCVVSDPTGYTFEVNLHSDLFGYGSYKTDFCRRIINLSRASNNINGIKVTPYITPHDYTTKRTVTLQDLINNKKAIIAPYSGKIAADDWFDDRDGCYKAEFEKMPAQRVILKSELRVQRPDYTNIVINPTAPSIIEGGISVKCNTLNITGATIGVGRKSLVVVKCENLILGEGLMYIGPKAFKVVQAKYIEIPQSLEYAWYDNFCSINKQSSMHDKKIVEINEREFTFNCKNRLITDKGLQSKKTSIRQISQLAKEYGSNQ